MRNDLFLLDTSVWLEVLLPGRATPALRARVDALLAADRVATTNMVVLELLGGARSQTEWDRLSGYLGALHQLSLGDEDWREAARMGFHLRCRGVAIPFTDLIIGAATIRTGAVLVHRDRHFDLMAAHLPLKVESYLVPEPGTS